MALLAKRGTILPIFIQNQMMNKMSLIHQEMKILLIMIIILKRMLSLESIKFKILKNLQKIKLIIHFIKMMKIKIVRLTDKRCLLK